MTRDPSSVDSVLTPQLRRDLGDLVKQSFGLTARVLTGLELETVRSGYVIPCSVKKSIGCAHVPCTRHTLSLAGGGQVEECFAGLRWGFAPILLDGHAMAYVQVGPFFATRGAREKLVLERPELRGMVEDYPLIERPETGLLRLISQWVSELVNARLRERELAKKETMLLSLVDSSKHLASMSDPEELLSYFTEISVHVTEACSGFILCCDGSGNTLKIVAASGVGEGFDMDYRVPRGTGITGWVLEHGTYLNVPDVDRDPRYIGVGYKAAAELAVPVRSGDRVVGVLVVDSMREGAFSSFHVRVLEGLATQVAMVLETLDHREDGTEKLRRLTALHTVSTSLNSSLGTTQVLRGVLDTISELFHATGCSIFLREGKTGSMLVKSGPEEAVSEVTGIDLNQDRGLLGHVLHHPDPILVRPDQAELFDKFRDFISSDISSIMCVPLRTEEEMLGNLFVAGSGRITYGEEEMHLLTTIGGVVSQAVHRGQLFERSQRQIAELSVIAEMGKAMNSTLDLDGILDYVVNMVGSIIEAESGSLMLMDAARGGLRIVAAKNLDPELMQTLELKAGEGVAGWVAQNRLPLNLENAQMDERYRNVGPARNPFSMISVPLVNKDKVVGVMNFERPVRWGAPFTEEDLDLVGTLASQAAVAIENATLYRNLIQVHFETIQSLVNALEAKDRYTHGHSRRVSKDCVRIAQRLKLEPKDIETVRHAALLHDIGKIGVKDSILLKPGSLTDDEVAHIRRHPQLGASILQSVEQLREVARLVRHHHERMDGRGYPSRLKSEEIPLGSRMICIADAFDAMITTRPYREGMPIDRAVEELVRGRGTQFDAPLVDVFVEILKEHHPSMAENLSRIQERGGREHVA